MKKYFYLILISVLLSFKASGQGPTLTFANTGPVPGDIFTSYNADTTGITNGTAGANQTWNYSGLLIDTSTTIQNYIEPSTTIYTDSFPSATVCYLKSPLYSYLRVNASEYSILGISSPSYTLVYSDPEILFNYPFSFGQSSTDSLKGSYSSGGISFYRRGIRTASADGFGTLILPSGTFTNLLRVKMIQDYIDSTSMGNVTHVYNISYLWYDGVHKDAVLRIYNTSNTNGGSTSTARFVTVSSAVSAISDIDMMKDFIHIYPNPSSDVFSITANSSLIGSTYYIIDQLGRIILSGELTKETSKVDINQLAAGVYLFQIGEHRRQSLKMVKK